MIPRHAHVSLGVPRVAVVLVRLGRLPVVMAEMRLREGHQHPHVIRRPQDFREAEVRARFAAIVVGVDEVDAETLQALQAFPRARVGGPCRAHLGVVQRHARQENAAAVQDKVAALNPKFAESEALLPSLIQNFSGVIEER